MCRDCASYDPCPDGFADIGDGSTARRQNGALRSEDRFLLTMHLRLCRLRSAINEELTRIRNELPEGVSPGRGHNTC